MTTQNTNNEFSKMTANKTYYITGIGIKKYKYIKGWEENEDKDKKYWVNPNCYNFVERTFKIIDRRFVYLYNDELIRVDNMYIETEDEIKTCKGKMLKQSLIIEGDYYNFKVYINHYNKMKIDKTYVFYNVLFINKRIVIGYDPYEQEYFDLTRKRDFILSHIDKNIARRIEEANDYEPLNIYASILNNNLEKCGIKYPASSCITLEIPMDNNVFDFTNLKPISELNELNE